MTKLLLINEILSVLFEKVLFFRVQEKIQPNNTTYFLSDFMNLTDLLLSKTEHLYV